MPSDLVEYRERVPHSTPLRLGRQSRFAWLLLLLLLLSLGTAATLWTFRYAPLSCDAWHRCVVYDRWLHRTVLVPLSAVQK